MRIVVCRYYGGTRTSEERRVRDWDRDKMVRDYVRTGRGWSQPATTTNGGTAASGVTGVAAGGRRLPRTPHTGAINAMAALQGMLGINQNNLSTVSMNGPVPNINNSISNRAEAAPGAPGRPRWARAGAGQGGWLSKLFKRSSARPQQETISRLQQQLLANIQQSSQHQQHVLAAALVPAPPTQPTKKPGLAFRP